jgi:PadR family transcriptional regulator
MQRGVMQRGVLKGHVDLLLLAALADGPKHGYGVVELVRARSEGAFELGEGTVYPALYRLERQGFVESVWAEGKTRQRRVYRLTRRGRAELARQRAGWGDYVRTMEAALA